MASTRQLKSRIRSVKNTKQITKAMQMVAASKMRRAQDATKASAPYTRTANEILTSLGAQGATNTHMLFQSHPVKKRLLIVVTSDKGLAGAYNSNVLKTYIAELKSDEKNGIANETIAVGRKVSQFISRIKSAQLVGSYENLPDQPSGHELQSIIGTAMSAFASGDIDAVDLIFTEFVSSMTQTPKVQRILPAGYTDTKMHYYVRDALY